MPEKAIETLGSRFVLGLATAGGAGLVPLAPGTAGSVVGVLVFVLLSHLELLLYGLTVATLTVLGIWVASQAERVFGSKDDGRIVIDEVAGQLVALSPLVPLRASLGGNSFWLLVVTGFVLFRLFDVWKPGPVRWAEQHLEGGMGVMLDDVVAGVLAAALLLVCIGLSSWFVVSGRPA